MNTSQKADRAAKCALKLQQRLLNGQFLILQLLVAHQLVTQS